MFLLLLLALTTNPATDCRAVTASVIQKMKAEYLGYPLIVERTPGGVAAFEAMTAQWLAEAGSVADEQCAWFLADRLDELRDGHLFVLEADRDTERFGTDGRDLLAREVEPAPGRSEDPIIGDWFDRAGGRYRIVSTRHDDRFAALAADDAVVADFQRHGDGYRVRLVGESGRLLHRRATLQRGSLLHMPPTTWGRVDANAAPLLQRIDATDPRAPLVAAVDDDTVYVSLPSMAPEYRASLQQLVDDHHQALVAARLIVLDLRANEGGSSGTTAPLAPYLYAEPHRPAIGATGPALVLATADTERYLAGWARFWETPPDWYPRLMARLATHDRALVPMDSGNDGDSVWKPEVVHPGVRRTAVLLDGDSVSAAEAAALWARRQAGVRLVGAPTGGSIDLQTVLIHPVGPDSWGYLLGLPVIAAGDDIATRGVNRTGVPVDVPLDWSTAADPWSVIRSVFDDVGD